MGREKLKALKGEIGVQVSVTKEHLPHHFIGPDLQEGWLQMMNELKIPPMIPAM